MDDQVCVRTTQSKNIQSTVTHHNAFDLCRSNECRVQRLPFLTFDAISSAALDLQQACQLLHFEMSFSFSKSTLLANLCANTS